MHRTKSSETQDLKSKNLQNEDRSEWNGISEALIAPPFIAIFIKQGLINVFCVFNELVLFLQKKHTVWMQEVWSTERLNSSSENIICINSILTY
jgi:hypothetical protein